jgi:hypothetical protein
MGGVNSQRENGPKERENGLRPSNGSQQLKAEKSFISRGFSQRALPERQLQPLVVGGGRATVVKPSTVCFQWVTKYIVSGGC